MNKKKVFISHSSKTNFSEKILNQVYDGLIKKNFTVFVDRKNIFVGDKWRSKILPQLGMCHSAVLLFSKAALESDWVRSEATILAWRKYMQPQFDLVPVLVDIERDDSFNIFKPFQLEEIQFVKLDFSDKSDKNIELQSKKILDHFKEGTVQPENCRLIEWIENVAVYLKKVDEVYIERVAEILDLTEEDKAHFPNLRETIAHYLLHTDFKKVIDSGFELKVGMDWILFERFIKLVEPAWVYPDAACIIIPITKQDESKRFLAINGRYPETGICYIRRATCCAIRLFNISTTGVFGEDIKTDLFKEIDEAFYKSFNIRSHKSLEMIKKAIGNEDKEKRPIFIHIDTTNTLPNGILMELRKRYPIVTFVLLSGENFPDPDVLGIPTLEKIYPKLEQDQEDWIYLETSKLKSKQEE